MDFTFVAVIAVAQFFNFTNGFHDTANAIATIVSTRALSLRWAVGLAAILNFLGAFVSLKVAATVAKGIVTPNAITLHVLLAGLIGAILWNLLTWRFGLPTSSSHALIGGVAGAAVVSAGWHVIKWHGLTHKVLIPSFIAPFLGCAAALVLMALILRIVRKRSKTRVSRVFKRLQLLSGGFVAFTHGTNDAQKTMGVIALALIAAHHEKTFHVPLWVIVSSAAAMAAGTYVGGWRIIDTLGRKITHLEPQQGFAAETATAGTLLIAARFGFPVSTTHTISGSILGAGAASRPQKVDWRIVGHIGVAWLITIPCAAAVAALLEVLTKSTGSTGVVVLIAALIAASVYLTRNWTWETWAQLRTRLAPFQREKTS